jgi:hypothetical protein
VVGVGSGVTVGDASVVVGVGLVHHGVGGADDGTVGGRTHGRDGGELAVLGAALVGLASELREGKRRGSVRGEKRRKGGRAEELDGKEDVRKR